MISSLLYKAKIVETDWIDLPEYLAAQDLFPKFYHKCKDTKEERAAFGSLVTLPFIPALSKEIDPDLCFYGAVSFPSKRKDPLWNDFSSILFFLPLYEIRQTKEKTTLYIRALPSARPLNPSIDLTSSCFLNLPVHSPTKEDWQASIHSVLEKVKRKKLQKVVLSRRSSFPIDATTHPFCFLKKLIEEAPSTTTFALSATPGSLFLGSSPEMLYQRKNKDLQTVALAGTRRRSLDQVEDEILKKALRNSAKDQKEVLHVKTYLEKKLLSFSEKVSFSKTPSLIQTEKLHHLQYLFTALLQDGVTDADLLNALHPTPAVGGSPSDLAIQTLQEIEGHGRGLYAGPIGWTSSLESSFTVAIRSSLIKEGFLHAFAGAGILCGSDPESEWEELNSKISHWKSPCSI